MVNCLIWFGIGAICGAMMLVAYSVITFDERKKKQKEVRLRGTNVPHQSTVPKMPEMQERKERSEDDERP